VLTLQIRATTKKTRRHILGITHKEKERAQTSGSLLKHPTNKVMDSNLAGHIKPDGHQQQVKGKKSYPLFEPPNFRTL
jgi:hypothetical protein